MRLSETNPGGSQILVSRATAVVVHQQLLDAAEAIFDASDMADTDFNLEKSTCGFWSGGFRLGKVLDSDAANLLAHLSVIFFKHLGWESIEVWAGRGGWLRFTAALSKTKGSHVEGKNLV